MKKNKLKPALFILILGAVTWGSVSAANNGPDGRPPVEVTAIQIQARSLTVGDQLPGRVVSRENAEIRPQVTGIITARLFEEGSMVEEGQQLYQIDPALYEVQHQKALADLEKAEAVVTSLEAKHGRYKELVVIEAVSKQDFDDVKAELARAKADVSIAKASVAQAEINLKYTKVYAPMSGRIGASFVTKGALVTANQAKALAMITVLDPIFVDLTVPRDSLVRLRKRGDTFDKIPIKVRINDGEPEYEHAGKLLYHEVMAEETTGSITMRSSFPNPDMHLMPGMFVRARLQMNYPNALLVPQRATTRQPDGSLSVWVVKDNVAQPVKISVARAVEHDWLVTDGVQSGDVIVVEGAISLSPGAPVNAVIKNAEN